MGPFNWKTALKTHLARFHGMNKLSKGERGNLERHSALTIRRFEWLWIAIIILHFPEFKIFIIDSCYLPRSTDTIVVTFCLIIQFHQSMDCLWKGD